MLNFVVCDDNKVILDRLVKMLENIFIKNDLDAKVLFYTTSASKLQDYIDNNSIDVLILDIDLKSKYSGLEIAKQIRERNKNVYLIFSTAHLEYALMAYKLKTFDYLPKPITDERLEETILRIFEDVNESKNNTKFLKIGNSQVLVKEDDVKYIKRDGMKTIYYTTNKKYETYSSLNKIEESLPDNFVRCHKSYIVNVNNITNIESNKNTIKFNSNECCFIGPKYKNNLMEVFNNGNITKYMDSID